MKRFVILGSIVGLVLLLLVTLASAGISCPCSRPGTAGIPSAFTCRNGTTDGVVFYNGTAARLGDYFEVWALKNVSDTDVPVRNLTVSIIFNKKTLFNLTTDNNGFISFNVDEPGIYDVCAGDSKLSFEIKSLNQPEKPPSEPDFGNDSEIGKTCAAASDCKLPVSYAMRSACRFEMRCLDSKCAVVCPLGLSCETGIECAASSLWLSDFTRSVCLSGECIALVGKSNITNFMDCWAAGYPVMESYPRRCSLPNGTTFTEVITLPIPQENNSDSNSNDTGTAPSNSLPAKKNATSADGWMLILVIVAAAAALLYFIGVHRPRKSGFKKKGLR